MNYETFQQIKKEQIETYISRIPIEFIELAYTLIKQRKNSAQMPQDQRNIEKGSKIPP